MDGGHDRNQLQEENVDLQARRTLLDPIHETLISKYEGHAKGETSISPNFQICSRIIPNTVIKEANTNRLWDDAGEPSEVRDDFCIEVYSSKRVGFATGLVVQRCEGRMSPW